LAVGEAVAARRWDAGSGSAAMGCGKWQMVTHHAAKIGEEVLSRPTVAGGHKLARQNQPKLGWQNGGGLLNSGSATYLIKSMVGEKTSPPRPAGLAGRP
jgi:hypothetical protein